MSPYCVSLRFFYRNGKKSLQYLDSTGFLVFSVNRKTQLSQPVINQITAQVGFWGVEAGRLGGDLGIYSYANVLYQHR